MDLPADVEAVSAEAAAAVEALMSPTLPPGERQRIYELCERLKESPLALQCGVYLSASHRPSVVRYFGLQVVENAIKFRWNDLPVEEKVFLKDACLDLMSTADASSPPHMRDALCRPLVEMVKREWPQQYPEFLPDLDRLAARGPLHTELALRVLLRLAEDVATFQNLDVPTRRRDIYRSLVASMDTVFALLTSTLTTCVSASGPEDQNDQTLAGVCLATLACYLEWAAVQHVSGDALLQLLLRLLEREALRQQAAECLVVLFSRHGRPEERERLLAVFQPAAVALLAQQVSLCCGQPPSDALLATLRLLAQALAGAVSQLLQCWGRAELTVGEPPALGEFLRVLMALSELPCGSVGELLLPTWTALLKHKEAGRCAPVLAAAPALFGWLQRRARRAQDPAAEVWKRLELEEEEEQAFRPELTDTLRALAAAAPSQTFALLAEGVSRLVAAPLPSDAGPSRLDPGAEALKDWTTAVHFTSHVAPRAAALESEAERGEALLGACLARRSADPQVLTLLVSLLSSLAAFLPRCPRLAPPLLDRLFEAVTFPLEGDADTDGRDLRRHGCNALIALALKLPAALAAHWQVLAGRVRALLAEPGQRESVTLSELLVMIHARIGNYQQQSELIGALLEPHLPAWRTLAEGCRSPAAFVKAVGLDSPPLLQRVENGAGAERPHWSNKQLMTFVNLLNAVLLRCRVSRDPDRLRDGGFTDPASGAVRNPCAPHVLPHLPLVFQLLRTLSALESPENLARMHPEFRECLRLSTPRRQALLTALQDRSAGDVTAARSASPLERMQGFLAHVYESCHTVLVNAAGSLAGELFAVPRLGDYLTGSVLHCVEHLSDHRLRVQLRSLWRVLLLRCPPDLLERQLAAPLAALLDHLVTRLDARWAAQGESGRAGEREEQGEEEDVEAVVAELLLRQVTRESVTLAHCLLTTVGTGATTTTPGPGQEDDAMEEGDPTGAEKAVVGRTVNAAGMVALRCPQLARPLTTLVFRSVGWGDSVASQKASDLSMPLLKAMMDAGLVDDTAASQVLYWLLHGLETQGHHSANFSSLLAAITFAYVCLKPAHGPAVDAVIAQIPEVTPEMVQTLEERVFRNAKIAMSDKLKKEEVKRVVKPLVSRSLSQLFQKKAAIRNLAPLPRPARPEPAAAEMVSLADLFGDPCDT